MATFVMVRLAVLRKGSDTRDSLSKKPRKGKAICLKLQQMFGRRMRTVAGGKSELREVRDKEEVKWTIILMINLEDINITLPLDLVLCKCKKGIMRILTPTRKNILGKLRLNSLQDLLDGKYVGNTYNLSRNVGSNAAAPWKISIEGAKIGTKTKLLCLLKLQTMDLRVQKLRHSVKQLIDTKGIHAKEINHYDSINKELTLTAQAFHRETKSVKSAQKSFDRHVTAGCAAAAVAVASATGTGSMVRSTISRGLTLAVESKLPDLDGVDVKMARDVGFLSVGSTGVMGGISELASDGVSAATTIALANPLSSVLRGAYNSGLAGALATVALMTIGRLFS